MKQHTTRLIVIAVLLLGLFGVNVSPAGAQDPTPTSTATATATLAPTATNNPTATATLEPRSSTERPLVVIKSYYLDKDTIRPGSEFRLYLSVQNDGSIAAHNLIFGFSGTEFLPKETGGVVAVGSVSPGESKDISQPLVATSELWGKVNGTVSVRLSYNGSSGEAFSESFTITLPVLGWSGNVATTTPTPTVTSMPRAQLVVSGYQTDANPLQPGTIFNLGLEVRNLGSGDARAVTMVLGGGTYSGSESTPQPGGVSGSGADVSVFAPIGSSNLQFLGDITPGAGFSAKQQLIVNVSANPGAYALKISFVYSDAKGNRLVDDQVITLLVYQLPQVEVNFYRDPGPISAMAPNMLPLQVVNLGRKATVMGNMTVSAENAELMNNTSLVGTLEAGGYFTLDAMLIPQAPGPLELKVTINYTDDFNQSRTITQTIQVEVLEGAPTGPEGAPGMEPGMSPGPEGAPVDMPAVEETTWQKILRFLKGLIGLDSAPPSPEIQPLPGDVPPDGEMPGGKPLPALPGGRG